MLKTFLLLAYLNGDSYILDSGLSATDCLEALLSTTRVSISATESVPAAGATLACEAEQPEE